MIASFEPFPVADLKSLRAAIVRSPILLRSATSVRPFADWAKIRQSPDVDAFILAWIASHVRDARRRLAS
jgi:hypothetical protein